MDLDSLLTRAIDAGATDVHLKVGGPPRIRTDGRLRPLEDARLDEADLTAVVEQVCAASPGRRDSQSAISRRQAPSDPTDPAIDPDGSRGYDQEVPLPHPVGR
jgi:Tfp pilus assembly pilus retraction ATPase PilT